MRRIAVFAARIAQPLQGSIFKSVSTLPLFTCSPGVYAAVSAVSYQKPVYPGVFRNRFERPLSLPGARCIAAAAAKQGAKQAKQVTALPAQQLALSEALERIHQLHQDIAATGGIPSVEHAKAAVQWLVVLSSSKLKAELRTQSGLQSTVAAAEGLLKRLLGTCSHGRFTTPCAIHALPKKDIYRLADAALLLPHSLLPLWERVFTAVAEQVIHQKDQVSTDHMWQSARHTLASLKRASTILPPHFSPLFAEACRAAVKRLSASSVTMKPDAHSWAQVLNAAACAGLAGADVRPLVYAVLGPGDKPDYTFLVDQGNAVATALGVFSLAKLGLCPPTAPAAATQRLLLLVRKGNVREFFPIAITLYAAAQAGTPPQDCCEPLTAAVLAQPELHNWRYSEFSGWLAHATLGVAMQQPSSPLMPLLLRQILHCMQSGSSVPPDAVFLLFQAAAVMPPGSPLVGQMVQALHLQLRGGQGRPAGVVEEQQQGEQVHKGGGSCAARSVVVQGVGPTHTAGEGVSRQAAAGKQQVAQGASLPSKHGALADGPAVGGKHKHAYLSPKMSLQQLLPRMQTMSGLGTGFLIFTAGAMVKRSESSVHMFEFMAAVSEAVAQGRAEPVAELACWASMLSAETQTSSIPRELVGEAVGAALRLAPKTTNPRSLSTLLSGLSRLGWYDHGVFKACLTRLAQLDPCPLSTVTALFSAANVGCPPSLVEPLAAAVVGAPEGVVRQWGVDSVGRALHGLAILRTAHAGSTDDTGGVELPAQHQLYVQLIQRCEELGPTAFLHPHKQMRQVWAAHSDGKSSVRLSDKFTRVIEPLWQAYVREREISVQHVERFKVVQEVCSTQLPNFKVHSWQDKAGAAAAMMNASASLTLSHPHAPHGIAVFVALPSLMLRHPAHTLNGTGKWLLRSLARSHDAVVLVVVPQGDLAGDKGGNISLTPNQLILFRQQLTQRLEMAAARLEGWNGDGSGGAGGAGGPRGLVFA